MNADHLRDLGFQLHGRAENGESDSGAWFATASDGTPVVLKWFPDALFVDRYTELLPALDILRSRRVPVPEYLYIGVVEGMALSAQRRLPGRPWESTTGHGARVAPLHLVERVVECVASAAALAGPQPTATASRWGEFMIHSLTVGENGWAMHEPMRSWSAPSARLLDRIEHIGAEADASWFPTSGLVHMDLHTGNLLSTSDGVLTGVVDWEGACHGDHHFDLVTFAFDLQGAGQQIWKLVESMVDARVLPAYVAHLALRCTDWAIRHHPDDVPRQLERAEWVLDRYGS